MDVTRVRTVLQRIVRSRLTAYLAGALGLMLVGGFVGHAVNPPTVVAGPTYAAPSPRPSVAPVVDDGVMPDVLGLEPEVAQRVLRDAGVSVELSVEERPAAGVSGLVVEQAPLPGADPGDRVVVTVGTTARMPDLVGLTSDEARAALEDLGAVVVLDRVVRPARAPDLVVATTPAAGADVTDAVTLGVSDPGESLGLEQLSTLDDDGCGYGDRASVGGEIVRTSLTCSPYRAEPAYLVWNLSRKAVVLTGVAGLDDRGSTRGASLRVIADGHVLLERDLVFGEAVPLRVDVSGVLRLRVETTSVSADGSDVVLGDLAVVGRPEDVAALQDLG